MKWIQLGVLGGALLCGSCSDSPKEVPFGELEERFHLKGEKDPFTGTAVTTGNNGQTAFKARYVDGLAHGAVASWYPNGNKEYETEYRQGVQHGSDRWWYSTGKRMTETQYEKGLMVSGSSWDPQGIPSGRVENGNGALIGYHENGSRRIQSTFKDGVPISHQTWNPDGTPVAP